MYYLVRIGLMGNVGRFQTPSKLSLPYGTRVVCQTVRGLEVGEILQLLDPQLPSSREAGNEPTAAPNSTCDGEVLRPMTPQDQLLAARLEQNRVRAIDDCQLAIQERGLSVLVVDAEQTFDGKNLYFYFLGEVTSEVDELTEELARTYDTRVRFSEFAETLEQGCGPGCGTENGGGCGTNGCSSCGLMTACRTR